MAFVCKKTQARWFPWFLSLTPSPVLIIPKATVTIFSKVYFCPLPIIKEGGGSHHIPAYSTPVHP